MKKIIAILLAGITVISLTGCGSSAEGPAAGSNASIEDVVTPSTGDSTLSEASTEDPLEDVVDMLYYKRLGDDSIMAACYTEEGIARLGNDYYVVHVGEAKIYDAQGKKVTLDELVRGCPIEIQWPGMVAMSYPGQISASVVTALSDEPDPAVPPEDEIRPIGDGPAWWEEETVTEVPDLNLEYQTTDFVTMMRIVYHTGSWTYSEEGSVAGGGTNAAKDGLAPQEWTYDDNNTIKRAGFDTIKLSTYPEAQEITVTAYPAEDSTAEGTALMLDENGTLELLDGAYIYEVSCVWNGEQYQGEAVYGFKVVEP